MSEASSPSVPVPATETCSRCGKTLTATDRVAAGDHVFCRSCYDTLRHELTQAVEQMSSDVPYARAALGAVLGGAVGAVVGSKVGKGDERVVTTLGGAVIGAVVGGAVGKSMDDADQACAAQAMEYASFKQSVRWHNPQRGASYTMTPVGLVPVAGRGVECRRYSILTEHGSMKEATQGTACRQRDGSWRLSS